MKTSRAQFRTLALVSLILPACNAPQQEHRRGAPKITAMTVQFTPVPITQQYACQIRSHHQIKLRAPVTGNLGPIEIKEGQSVQEGDLLFQIIPLAATPLAVSPSTAIPSTGIPSIGKSKEHPENEEKAVLVIAPFDGIVDTLLHHQGDRLQSGDTPTTLSDNSQMWAYFNVSESRYLEFMAAKRDEEKDALKKDDLKIELLLADGNKFDQVGKLGAIVADFNPETGSIPFRADFPNPDGLLRNGQAGTVLITRGENDAIVIPQRAAVEEFQKRYVYVIDKERCGPSARDLHPERIAGRLCRQVGR